MNVAVIIHTASEGPGSLGDYLLEIGSEINTVRLDLGHKLPDLRELDAVISMGGTMNVYDEEEFPFLKDETIFLKEAIESGVPILGICLGAQMIAKAAGEKVIKSPKPEIGWSMIELLPGHESDALFRGLPKNLEVFQYHGDMFHVPKDGRLLASSEACPHQAFRINNAYGLQFHVETTSAMIREWFLDSGNLNTMLFRYSQIEGSLNSHARIIYDNFLAIVEMHKNNRI